MSPSGQLSLLSRGPLFERQVREQYVADVRKSGIPQEAQRTATLRQWVTDVAEARRAGKTKETSLEQAFNQTVFGDVLGYTLYPDAAATAWPKTPTSATGFGKEPDVMLGRFVPGEEPEFFVAVELKPPGTDLDAPQVGRTPPLSPVEQGFQYGENILGVRWVLVSDMEIFRLYSVESPHEFATFKLADCVEGPDASSRFRELFGFLSMSALVDQGNESAVSRLLSKSVSRQLLIRDSFYEAYYQIRADVLDAVRAATATFTPRRFQTVGTTGSM